MTEEQKYQGALYKPKKQKQNHQGNPSQVAAAAPQQDMAPTVPKAYVEDVTEGFEAYRDYSEDDNKSPGFPPKAPTPPPADGGDGGANVNVFDFMVADATPNASRNQLPLVENNQLVRLDKDPNETVDLSGYMVDDEEMMHDGDGALAAPAAFQTPAPKADRRKSREGETKKDKKDKKRKRLRIDTSPPAIDGSADHDMTDAPPELHTGLTGGLKSLMRPSVFPPSPDYSGGDNAEPSADSPTTKKTKSKSKTSRTETMGGLKALVAGPSKSSKVSKKRKHSSERKEKKHHRHRSEAEKSTKLIDYRPSTADGKETDGQLIVYKPRPDLFLGLCTKGPDSERGYSVNKALKRFHRERDSSGTSLGKAQEEKELWRTLRMRRNEQGEIVLFSL